MNEQTEKVVDGITYERNYLLPRCFDCVAHEDEGSLCTSLQDSGCAHSYTFKIKDITKQSKVQATLEGVKYDQDKIKYSLLPSYALEAAAKNMTDGLKKYPERDNWMKVDNAQERYLDALYRHLESHRRGDVYDTESSDPTNTHLAAVVVNAMFLLEFLLNPELNKGKNE